MILLLNRETQSPVQTLGKLHIINDELDVVQELHTLELPWLNNQKGISCIPKGDYILRPRYSEKYKDHYIILNNSSQDHPYPRTFILIHPANYVTQLRGCIAVGMDRHDINADGTLDITSSRNAMQILRNFIGQNEVELIIT